MKDNPPQVPIRQWASIHSELHWIYDHTVPSASIDRWVNGADTEYRAWLVHRGSVQVETPNGKIYQAVEGQWIFPPQSSYQQRFTQDTQILSIHFKCIWPSGEKLFSGRRCVILESKDYPALERRARQLHRAITIQFPDLDTRYFRRFAEYEQFLSMHTMFLKWLSAWVKAQRDNGHKYTRLGQGDDRALQAMHCLHASPLSEGFPVSILKQETKLGEAHLNRLFFAEYGTTLRKAWNNRRLKEAQRLLGTSRIHIKEIAYNLGFKSDSHFMIWFKKHTNLRPGQFRKNYRSPTQST